MYCNKVAFSNCKVAHVGSKKEFYLLACPGDPICSDRCQRRREVHLVLYSLLPSLKVLKKLLLI